MRTRTPLTSTYLLGALLLTFAGACGGGDDRAAAAGASTTASGDVSAELPTSVASYEVTSERYDRWVRAQAALDALSGLTVPPLDASRIDDAGIDRVVASLEADARARQAIERSGISVRDYVLTTIALDQALATAEPAPTAGAAASAPPAGASRSTTPTTRAATRTARVAPRTMEFVARNRARVARTASTRRYRVTTPAPATSESTAGATVSGSATAAPRLPGARTDSVVSTTRKVDSLVDRDVTVKYDITVRRKQTGDSAKRVPKDTTRPAPVPQ